LPVLGGGISMLNILSTATGGNATFRKFSKFMKVMPLLSIPIWMTFPAAFNLYWLVNSSSQLLCLNAFRWTWFRKYMGLPDYLPGTKLEKMNIGRVGDVFKPKIYSGKPS
jgi:hypothetical protein